MMKVWWRSTVIEVGGRQRNVLFNITVLSGTSVGGKWTKFTWVTSSRCVFLIIKVLIIWPDNHADLVHSFIHSFGMCRMHWMIPCHCQELLPFLSVMCFFLSPFTNYSSILSYFLVYLSVLLFPNSYTIPFWEFYFLPFSVHAQTNVIYLTLLSLL